MSELYELPKEWEWKKLDELTEVNIGKTPTRSKKEFFLGDKIWLSIRDLKNTYISKSNEMITDEAIKNSNIKIIKKGTLLMSFKLTLGRTAFADCDLYTNEAIASLPIKDNSVLDKYFLNYSIGVIDLEKEVDNAVKGKTLNKQKIKNLDIPLPPLPEQQRIVSKLDTLFKKIDYAIALHQKNMDEADLFMGSVLNKVFGELEEKYGLSSFSTIVKNNKIQNGLYKHKDYYNENGTYILRIDNFYHGKVNDFGIKRLSLNNDEINKYLLNENDIIINRVNSIEYLGKCAFVGKQMEPMVFESNMMKISVKNNIDSMYVVYILQSASIKNQISKKAKRAVNQCSINQTDVNTLLLPLPPLKTQQKTVTYLDSISQKTEKLKQIQKEKMDSLIALKASILDQAFRGAL